MSKGGQMVGNKRHEYYPELVHLLRSRFTHMEFDAPRAFYP